jgi:hypothetical protein
MFGPRFKLGLKVLGFGLGVALVAAAVISALRRVDLAPLWHVPAWLLAGSVAMILANLLLTGVIFWLVTLSFDAQPQVSLRDQWDLACASTLLNYLPVRPGLAGRTAYLRLRHGLPILQALIIAGIVFGLFLLAAMGAAVVLLGAGMGRDWRAMAGGVGGLVFLSVATGPVARVVLRRPMRMAWAWLPLRALDLLTVGGRLWPAFAILGHPIGAGQAVLLGAVDAVVSVVALMPNGLGVSEWATGLVAMQIGAAGGRDIGAAAKLVDRSISIVVLVPVALWSLHRLHRAAGRREGDTSER